MEKAQGLAAIIAKAFADNTVVIIDVTVDYSENMKLTEKLGQLLLPALGTALMAASTVIVAINARLLSLKK